MTQDVCALEASTFHITLVSKYKGNTQVEYK